MLFSGQKGLRTALVLSVLVGMTSCDEATVGNAGSESIFDERGQWTFINYWAEWCAPCIKEIPELNALHAREGYRVLGINFDGETGENLAVQEQKLGVTFPTVGEDPTNRFSVQTPSVLPTTLVVSPDGTLVEVLVGPQTQESLMAVTGRTE
ncbi:MAG: TlpA disulfide reductase family protein [Pseudomonadota bacterium]